MTTQILLTHINSFKRYRPRAPRGFFCRYCCLRIFCIPVLPLAVFVCMQHGWRSLLTTTHIRCCHIGKGKGNGDGFRSNTNLPFLVGFLLVLLSWSLVGSLVHHFFPVVVFVLRLGANTLLFQWWLFFLLLFFQIYCDEEEEERQYHD